MDFAVARPDVIRAINQRWLLNFWTRSQDAGSLPNWQLVEAENLSAISTNLSFLDVVAEPGGTRLMIRFHGELIGEVYGAMDYRGKFLDEIMPPQVLLHGLAPYRQAIETRRPVYTILDLTDRNGTLVHYERLLLPFGRDGRTVDRILASFEFISPDGNFESRGLISAPMAPPTLRLCATIDPSEA